MSGVVILNPSATLRINSVKDLLSIESLSLLAADYVNVLLMSEMSHPGKDHRHTVFIGRGDNLIVFDGTAGLDH